MVVPYESIQRWCDKFGADFANQVRRRRPQPGDKWHLDGRKRHVRGGLPECTNAVPGGKESREFS